MDIDALLADRMRRLRTDRGWTLVQLAERSQVSRSMLSLIERRETSPTAAVLNRLADAFGLSLAALFADADAAAAADPLARRGSQPTWTDPASGYLRRRLTPAGVPAAVDLVEVVFPAGQTVTFDNPAGSARVTQQLWLLEGTMEIRTVAADGSAARWTLAAGDCLAIAPAVQISFHNPAAQPARYLLALGPGASVLNRTTP